MSNNTPRPLHAARHEDSALFSVSEVLRATEAATARGRSDSSGFIDVRDLHATGSDLAGLQATPVRPAPRPRRPRGLHGVIATLALALVGSLTAEIAAPIAAQARDRDEAAEAAMYGAWEYSDEFDGDILVIPEDDDEVEPEPAPAPEAIDDEEAPAPAPVKATSKAPKKSRTPAKTKAPAKAPAPAVAEAPVVDAGPDPMSVECLLSPAACKRSPAPARPVAKAEPTTQLPAKLDAAALKAGASKARDAARSECARLAGGVDKVEVRMSILGRSGEVVSAKAQGAAAGTAAGRCVEEALTEARFDRFTAPQQGLVVTVRF